MNNCPHYDYGKSADKALGAYCTAKKKLVEPEDCQKCQEERQLDKEKKDILVGSF